MVTSTTVTVTQTAETWEDVVARVKSGVVSVGAVGCEGAFIGSGALIGPRTVLTAAHVVDLAGAVDVTGADFRSTAQVVGIDVEQDLALLELAEEPEGYRFEISPADPREASEVAVMGFPLGSGLSYTFGRVSALDQVVQYDDVVIEGAVRTDAAINGGNSGGPAVSRSGQLVGVVTGKRQWIDATDPVPRPAEGIGYLVSPTRAASAVERWTARPDPPNAPDCGGGSGYDPESELLTTADLSGKPDGGAILTALYLLGSAINASDYTVAFDFFSPQLQERMGGLDTWSAGLVTSRWTDVTVYDISEEADGSHALVELTTTQTAENGPEGQTCSVWWMDYTLQEVGPGLWQIDRVALPEGPPTACGEAGD